MATGAAWNEDDPTKPWALLDASSTTVVVFPINISAWISSLGSIYSSHSVVTASPLECVSPGAHLAGVLPVRMKLATGATYKSGTKYPFTIRLTTASGPDGGGPQTDDRTLWLKLVDR